MTTPIEQATTLQQVIEAVEGSNYHTLLPGPMPHSEKQLLLAAPSAAAFCLNTLEGWRAQPHSEIHLLLLNPSPLDAVDQGRSWGILPFLLDLPGLVPIHLTIVGENVELASSSAHSEELRGIQVQQHAQAPIKFLLDHPEYRADAAFLMHPAADFSAARSSALRELQQREIPLFGTSFSGEEYQQLEQHLQQRGIASMSWSLPNPFALALQQFNDANTHWADTLWQVAPQLLATEVDHLVGDLTRQTVRNIIEGGEPVTAQYLADLNRERSALTAMINLLGLLDQQSRSELSAHLFWMLMLQVRQGDAVDTRNELLQVMANLGWIGAADPRPE